MTDSSRKDKVLQMLEQDPTDQFLRYALAMELVKEDEHESSLELLAALTKDETPHVGAFFMSAQQLASLGRNEEAQAMLQEGIQQANLQGQTHAASEMTGFLASLTD